LSLDCIKAIRDDLLLELCFTSEPLLSKLDMWDFIQRSMWDFIQRSDTVEIARGAKGKLVRARRRLARRIHKLKRGRVRSAGTEVGGIDPEKFVWIFGSARTGSTWLGRIMADLQGHTGWPEPMVGYLFGHLYYERAADRHDDDRFILGGDKELWLNPVRAFVLDSAKARFPEVAEKSGYLIVKEPHGTQGAPLLMQALPESRMILLVRDPRDVVASQMDLAREDGRVRQVAKKRGQAKKNTSADERPDAFVKGHATRYLHHVRLAKWAYDAHGGHKVVVRYEDLRADTFRTMRRIYSALEIPIDERRLSRVVEKYTWENIPERKKGSGMFLRKATPGRWVDDLTPKQAKTVERITAPLLAEFYAEDYRPWAT
jgi:hypothetical protein